jgi:predicted TIM-barrel fold metal-dependent hydrolase
MPAMRIDTHHHMIPPDYRAALDKAGIADAGGRGLPEWSAEASLNAMSELDVAAAVLSVSAPATSFLTSAADAAALARDVNDYSAELVAAHPDRLGFFATVPMPHVGLAVRETVRALDELAADGVVLLANHGGTYVGQDGQDELFAVLDARCAVVFIHPAELPGPTVPGVPPWATDFLLDTTRAAFLLVRNGIRRRFPNIRFILSHAGGFVPYTSHRMALAITAETGRSPADSLDEFSSFYFDTALSSSAATLPTLLAFAKPGHITFGSDFPFATVAAAKLFAAGLETYSAMDTATRDAIDYTNALALFGRFGTAPSVAPASRIDAARHAASRVVMRGVVRLMNSN